MKKPILIDWVDSDIERKTISQEAPYDEEHHNAIVKILMEGDYVICGDTHQSNQVNCIPLFNDGYIFLSMRSWGKLMAEAQNKKLGQEKYDYMDFYMKAICPLEEKLPQK